ncbi:MAG: tyrosine-type recombinase/integrase [Chloroflexota bacterium]
MNATELTQNWTQDLEKNGKSAHTTAAYRRALEHFIAWNRRVDEGKFNPATIIPRDIENWKAYQQTGQNASPATTNQRLVALANFFRWAVSQGLARSNPAAGIKGVGAKKREPKALDEKKLRRLLRAVHAANNLRDIALVELLVGTGLRVSELLALKTADLALGDRSGKVVVRMGKHDNYREIPLTATLRQVLKAYLAEHPERENPNARLWIGQRGALNDRSAVLRILEKYAIAAQLPAMGPHVLRHTFATRYLRANPGDVRGLAALLGHSSLDTVMIYTEPSADDLAERIERAETAGAESTNAD